MDPLDKTSIRRWDHGGACGEVFIATSPALEQLLLDREAVGLEFSRRARAAVADLFGNVADELKSGNFAELVLLSKGVVYDLRGAAERAGVSLPTNLMATSREAVSGHDASVSVTYRSIATPAESLVIGDTVASGASICAAISAYSEVRPLRRVIVLALAGAGVGVRRIAHFCEARDIEFTAVLGLASFGLAPNGFDLSFLDEDTDCDARYREETLQRFGGAPVSAVGWDFGSQAIAEDKYRALCWVERKYWGLEQTDALKVSRRPTSRGQIEHERAAFQTRLPNIDELIALS